MVQIEKETERYKSKMEKNIATMERKNPLRVKDYEEASSSSSMSTYNLYSNWEYLDVPSNQYPTVVLHDARRLMHMEEV